MISFWGLMAIVMALWTGFIAMFTALWLARQISYASDASVVVPDEDSYFYLFGWQTWELSDLLRYLVKHYLFYWLPTIASAAVTIVLILAGSWQ